MKTKQLGILLLGITLFLGNMQKTEAQFWKKVTRKIQNKAENKVLQKVDKETGKTMDNALEGKPEKKKQKKKDTSTTDYFFHGSVTVEVADEANEGTKFSMLFSPTSKLFCIEMNVDKNNQVYSVISPDKTIAFMDMSGMKIKKESSISQYDNTDKIPEDVGEFDKTGKTKTILGYHCEEYIYQNDDGKASLWITKKFPIQTQYAPLLGMTESTIKNGFVMELTYTSKSGENGNVKVVKIEKDKKVTIKTNNYKSMF
jgi:hypothetical protein